MALSAVQKVVLFSCLVLCVSLLLPRAYIARGKQAAQEGNTGLFQSPGQNSKPTDGRPGGAHFPRSHMAEAVSKAKGGTGGGGGGTRPSLVGQIIPIYGFGILLYILYILFKLSSKGKNAKLEISTQPVANGNLKRKINDYELIQLQDKLKETEEAMEKIISRLGPNCESADNMSSDEEIHLLQRLKEITRVMKEGKTLDGISPEKEAEEAPYMEDWEGYPEETYPVYDPSDYKRTQQTILVDCSLLNQPSAEQIAEQMGFNEDDDQGDSAENVGKEPCVECDEQAHVTVSAENKVDGIGENLEEDEDEEEDDPEVIAENAGFVSDSCNEEEDSKETFMNSRDENESLGDTLGSNQDRMGTLRKRNTKGIVY
ncbi:RIC3 acetylcholine receptor chaperone S homeolog precursor [Xenopus laevis]|uniref:Chaperone protein RIC-3 n=1 Tax=Xenopus laevis TaxID=8355 RepID=C6ZEC3_XENLA|nr:RIC3 acetylcholine receptor chaperone S homeolog precursor [Xenopus laevis]ACF74450.1 chaperone protein RIC-3 [Xenopus laevis]